MENIKSIEKILEVVSNTTKIPVSEMIGRSRLKDIVISRDIAIGIIITTLDVSTRDLGNYFGKRQHDTIRNSRDKFLDIKQKPFIDLAFSKKLEQVLKVLN